MHSVKKVKTPADQLARKKKIEAIQIENYNGLIDQYLQLRNASNYSSAAFELTTKILSLNPESYSVWNYRREIFKNGLFVDAAEETVQQLLNDDLRFLEQRLREFPKVYWIWNHRRWCLETGPNPDWKRELGLVSRMLELDARNFHGWHYRRYIVEQIENQSGKSLVDEEFNYTTSKINSNFSNFSAWHNRTQLIPLHLSSKSSQERRTFLSDELKYITQALYTDPDDQSSWIYHQWLLTTDDVVTDLTKQEKIDITNREINSIKELYDLEPDSKWCAHQLVFLNQQLIKLKEEPLDSTSKSQILSYLNKLIDIDPLRINRYKYLISQINQS